MMSSPTTYHQLLKYPTPSEMAIISDDQAMAKTVAVVARKRSGWAQNASQLCPNEDFHVDKKQKRIVDQ